MKLLLTNFINTIFPSLYAQNTIMGDMDGEVYFQSIGFLIVFGLFVLLLVFHFYSIFIASLKKSDNRKFFLSTQYKIVDASFFTYLVNIDSRTVELISSIDIQPKTIIQVDVGILPTWNKSFTWITGKVISSKQVKGSPTSYTVTVRIDDEYSHDISEYLMTI